jgi:hypothetical protein
LHQGVTARQNKCRNCKNCDHHQAVRYEPLHIP